VEERRGEAGSGGTDDRDGQSSHTGIRDIVTERERDHVEVSTIGLGSGVDDGLLRMIASTGNGRAHFVRDVNTLPGTMVKEVGIVVR
jgi:Ca-activated chloride channel homolog